MSSSWLPFNFTLPSFQNIAPSLSIQRRFVSFILKRSLGHLLKPGQLDINQIDAQIGNGSVEIKDLILDESAINSFLTEAPVQLRSGTIGSVIVRIPWPNPFLATIGLSVSGLKLEFCVSDKKPAESDNFVSDLSQSVASVAETFLHEELSQREETELRNSIHVDFDIRGTSASFSRPPGSLDQFEHDPTAPSAADPEGISIFAGLLERLLARFDFDASDTQITLVNPGSASFTLRVEGITYAANGIKTAQTVEGSASREKRSVQISGIQVTMKDLEEREPLIETLHPLTTSTYPPTHPIMESSDSEMDEDTQMMMSHSLVSLPPRPGASGARPPSPALSTISSAASSLYQSAMSASAIPPSSPERLFNEPDYPAAEDKAMESPEQTLIEMSDPIVLQLTTPPAYIPANISEAGPPIQPSPDTADRQSSAKFELDISIGIIAIALHARSVNAILQLLDVLSKPQVTVTRPTPKSESGRSMSMADRLECSLYCKGIVAVVLNSPKDAEEREGKGSSLKQFFSRPLSQPFLTSGFLRLHLDTIEASTSPILNSQSTQSKPTAESEQRPPGVLNISLNISDVSILAFHAITTLRGSSSNATRNFSSPVLLSDANLTQSYYVPPLGNAQQQSTLNYHLHPHSEEDKSIPLPYFDVINWTKERERDHGTSLRPWRSKVHSPYSQKASMGGFGAGILSKVGLSTSPTRLTQSFLSTSPPQVRTLRSAGQHQPKQMRTSIISLVVSVSENDIGLAIRTVPFHAFLDLDAVESLLTFVKEALPNPSSSAAPTELPSPVYTEGHTFIRDKYAEERDQQAKVVSDDLEMEMNYGNQINFDGKSKPKVGQQRGSKDAVPGSQKTGTQCDLWIPLLRVEVRVPCQKNRHPRSGSLVVDVHSIHVVTGQPDSGVRRQRSVRIEGEDDVADFGDWISDEKGQVRMMVKLSRVIVAYAPLQDTKAQTILSLGSLEGTEKIHSDGNESVSGPLILLRSLDTGSNAQKEASAVVVYLPSLHANVDKSLLDGLQVFVDDIGQWSERTLGNGIKSSKTSTNTSPATTRNPSLIGSRYFVQRAGSGATESDLASTLTPKNSNQEYVVKAAVSKAFIRLIIPIVTPTSTGLSRYLDLTASGLDALVELKPDGKDETVISLNLRDVNVQQAHQGSSHTLLASNMNINRKSSVFRMRFRSVVLPGTAAKESRINLSLHGLRIDLLSELEWIKDLSEFVKNPPGTFESVIPSERTSISGHIMECALCLTPTTRSSSLVLSFGDVEASTDLVGDSPETSLKAYIGRMSVLLNGDSENIRQGGSAGYFETDAESWMKSGYALLITLDDLDLQVKHDISVAPPDTRIGIDGMKLCVHLCADSIAGIVLFVTDIQSHFAKEVDDTPKPKRRPANVSDVRSSNVLRSLDESAFRRAPAIGPLPDMIDDDLPTNLEYLDASFGAAAGLRPIEDEDDEFYPEDDSTPEYDSEQIVSRHGGETIKMFSPAINYVEHFYDTLTPSSVDYASEHGETSTKVRAENCEIHVLLYDGYDWERTRRAIQEEVKRVKRRLAKIRQLLANGQTYDPNVDEINTVLFNSVYVGLDQEAEEYERDALIAAIDDELHSDTEAATESSWQSFSPGIPAKTEKQEKMVIRGKNHKRAKSPSIEFSVSGMALEFDKYRPEANLASRLLFTIKDLEILDHIRTSTWSKFLSGRRSDTRGNIRETDSNMVRVELQMLLPYKGREEQEARLKAKLLPLRLHVDQDALDFLKKFFAFKDPDAAPSAPPEDEIFFQHVEIFPVDLKLDYKPRRVDYRALKEGKTMELMNFFHFDGAEMTLRHLTLKGITGWPRMFDTLNDLWTPDVKANQLAEVISGVSPIRSAVNVGSGVADLILLPIAQYKKDGRIIRGLQKGTTAFVKSTAMEAIRLGAQLATGTQVVLEQAESVLGGQYKDSITAEAVVLAPGLATFGEEDSEGEGSESGDLFSKYAEQPTNITEGVQSAYKSLSQNIKSAGQTILAVPMEVYERSGKEGPARAVIRAVPIAVLKPLIGASEAVSKTLLGIHGTLNPDAQLDTAVKYKQR